MNKFISLALWVITIMGIGSYLGSFTKAEIDTWYIFLVKSPLTPPNFVFGIAWSILYFFLGISGWSIWQAEKVTNLKLLKSIYTLQMVLNWIWTPVFFTYHMLGCALIILIIMILLVIAMMIMTYSKLNLVFKLMIPYLAWLTFASHLNFYAYWFN